MPESNNCAVVWEVKSGRELYRLPHAQPVRHLSFNADGSSVISCDFSDTISVWDAFNGKSVRTLRCWKDSITAFTASSDGAYVAACSAGVVEVWNAKTGLKESFFARGVLSLVSNSNGMRLAAILAPAESQGKYLDQMIATFDFNRDRMANLKVGLRTVVQAPYIAMGRDGQFAATYGDGRCRVFELESGTEVELPLGTTVRQVKFDAHGRQIAAVVEENNYVVEIIDLKSPARATVSLRQPNVVSALEFDPSGRMLVTGDDSHAIAWDIGSGDRAFTVPHNDIVTAVRFDPYGTYLASASREGSLKIVNCRTEDTLHRFQEKGSIESICFSPDGTLIAATINGRKAR